MHFPGSHTDEMLHADVSSNICIWINIRWFVCVYVNINEQRWFIYGDYWQDITTPISEYFDMTITLFGTGDPALVIVEICRSLAQAAYSVWVGISSFQSQSVILSHVTGDPPYSSYCKFYYLEREIPPTPVTVSFTIWNGRSPAWISAVNLRCALYKYTLWWINNKSRRMSYKALLIWPTHWNCYCCSRSLR